MVQEISHQPQVIVGVLRSMSPKAVAHTLHHVLSATLPVVAVVAHGAEHLVFEFLARKDVLVLPPGGAGMARCLAKGVGVVAQARGWILIPGDALDVRPQTLLGLADMLREHVIVHVMAGGRRCYPLGISADLYNEAVRLDSDEHLRRMLARYPMVGMKQDGLTGSDFALSELVVAY